MKTCSNLYTDLCSYDNLFLAYKKARKHKTLKPYVIEFERNLKDNLLFLRTELLLHSYRPMPLKTLDDLFPGTRERFDALGLTPSQCHDVIRLYDRIKSKRRSCRINIYK